jgi:ketosteroid isomerase-like protein
MKNLAISVLCVCSLLLATVVRADDVADVKAAELAFNAAQNAGRLSAMIELALPERTIFPPSGAELVTGWTVAGNAARQAAFDAGRKIDFTIDRLEVRVYGDSAIATFDRTGTVREVNGEVRNSRLHVTGIWVKQAGQWKLAHRHESPF